MFYICTVKKGIVDPDNRYVKHRFQTFEQAHEFLRAAGMKRTYAWVSAIGTDR